MVIGSTFEAQMHRIRLITGRRGLAGLADFFGVPQALVSDALRRGQIPAGWLDLLRRAENVSPEWILTGSGPRRPAPFT